MFIIVLIILCLLILTGLAFGLVFLLTWLTRLIFYTNKTGSFSWTKTQTRIILIISIFASIGLICYYSFSNPAKNFKTAYIDKTGDDYQVTLLGKRNLMTHDPISILKRETYIDSFKIKIPRQEGIIDGSELFNRPGDYKLAKGTTISIVDDKMKVTLLYDNITDKTVDRSFWNGEYDLQWRSGR